MPRPLRRRYRVRTHRDLATIHQGIVAAVQQQQNTTENPSPTAYFVYLLTLLSAPDPSMLPQLLTLLEQTLRQMPVAALRYAEAMGGKVSGTLLQVLRKFSNDEKTGERAFRCVKTLYSVVEVDDAALQQLQLFEPSKFNVSLMAAYNNLMQVVFVHLHTTNPALCRSRLPLFLERLIQQFLNDTREEVASSAASTMRRILGACVDAAMLEEDRACPDHLRPTTTGLSRTLALLTPMFDSPHFQSNWDLLAGVFGVVLRRMERDAFPRLTPIVRRMAEVHALNDFHYSTAMERGMGAAVRAMGAKNFFTIVPFTPLELDDKQAFLYRVIRKYVSHDSLGYWNQVLMPLAFKAQDIADREAATKNDQVARLYEISADRLWYLASAFCTFPLDFAEGNNFVTFAKAVTALWPKARPNTLTSTCHALRLLADKNRWLAEVQQAIDEDHDEDAADDDTEARTATTRTTAKTMRTVRTSGTFATLMADDRGAGRDELAAEDKARELEDPHGFHGISREQAERNVALLKKYSGVILPKLCNLFETCGTDEGGCVLMTIHSYAKVSTDVVLTQCFTTLTTKILDTPPEDADEAAMTKFQGTRHVMLDIAANMIAALSPAHLRILYGLLPPLLTGHGDPTLQKKAYRVLAMLHETQAEFMKSHLQNSLAMLRESCLQCAPASRLYRFRTLACLFRVLQAQAPDQIPASAGVFASEVLLSIPEPGVRMRDAAFGLIRMWGELFKATTGSAEGFFRLLMGNLDSTSETLQQSTVIALANVMVLHFADLSDAVWGDLIGKVVGKLAVDSRPICNAVLAFCKLALKVAVYHPPVLQAFGTALSTFLDGMVFWLTHEKEAKVRLQARILVERAIKRFGYERVLELTPKAKHKFVRYVEKQRLLQKRKKTEDRKKERMTTESWVKKFKQEFFEQGKGRRNPETGAKENRFVMQAGSTEPEDLLDPSIVKSFFIRPAASRTGEGGKDPFEGPEDDFEMTLDPTGKVLIADKDAPPEQPQGGESLFHLQAKQRAALQTEARKRRRGDDNDDDEDDGPTKQNRARAEQRNEGQCANRGFNASRVPDNMPVTQRLLDLKKHVNKRQRLTKDVVSGQQYASKRGTGDVLRRNAPDPYAYVPLNAGYLSKRNRKAAISRFATVTGPPAPRQTLPRSKRRAMLRHLDTDSKSRRREAL